nr:RHS repeat-associated core domain-containing protein [uncultured Pseudomonas sp.]
MKACLLTTDRQRSVLQGLRAYSPYGFSKATSAPALGFCGQRHDPLTGNYPLGNGHRSYSPTLMRFLSPDSLSPFDRGGLNSYAYCGGDPVNRIDPGAQFWQRVLGAFSSMVTGLGAIVRTARNEVSRLQHQFDSNSPYTPTPFLNRISNTSFLVTSASGISGNTLLGIETGWAPETFMSVGNAIGVFGSNGNIVGGVSGNFNTARETWQLIGSPGVAASSVAYGTFVEVTGLRMAGEALDYMGRQAGQLVRRLRLSAREAYRAWRQSGESTQAAISMQNIRQTPDRAIVRRNTV